MQRNSRRAGSSGRVKCDKIYYIWTQGSRKLIHHEVSCLCLSSRKSAICLFIYAINMRRLSGKAWFVSIVLGIWITSSYCVWKSKKLDLYMRSVACICQWKNSICIVNKSWKFVHIGYHVSVLYHLWSEDVFKKDIAHTYHISVLLPYL